MYRAFDQTFALFEAFDCVGPERFQPRHQRLVRAIGFTNPHERDWRFAQQPPIDEVFVLGDEDAIFTRRVDPDGGVACRVHRDVEDMARFMIVGRDPSRQRGRKLRVDEKLQDCCRTA